MNAQERPKPGARSVSAGGDTGMVLVTDAEVRAVVATCRGLGAAGFQVAAAATSHPAAAQWSRSCARRLTLPPATDDAGYADALLAALRNDSYAFLMPGTDRTLAAVSTHRERLPRHVATALPPHDAVLRALDKVRLASASSAVGLDAPAMTACATLDDALSAADEFSYPVLIKPQHVVTLVRNKLAHPSSRRVATPTELAAAFPDFGTPCLIQRVIPGKVVSFGGVQAGGRLIGAAVSRYERIWRPGSGNVAFSTSLEPPSELPNAVERLLRELGWEGIFELELIARSDGSYSAIDLNPRPYGSLALALKAGANLPAVWVRWALGENPEPVEARPGVHYRWEDADLRLALWNLRRRRLRTAASSLVPRRRVAHAYFRASDPGPFVARLLQGVRGRGGPRTRPRR